MDFTNTDKKAVALAPEGWKVRGANRFDGKHGFIVSSGKANIPRLSQRVPIVGEEIYNGHNEKTNPVPEGKARAFRPATIVNSIDHWPTQWLGKALGQHASNVKHVQERVAADTSQTGVHANSSD